MQAATVDRSLVNVGKHVGQKKIQLHNRTKITNNFHTNIFKID